MAIDDGDRTRYDELAEGLETSLVADGVVLTVLTAALAVAVAVVRERVRVQRGRVNGARRLGYHLQAG